MASEFPSSQYKYSGYRYNFTGSMYIMESPETTHFALNPTNVHEFSYVNRLGDLCLTAELVYTDDTGMLINFIHSQYVIFEVAHTVLDEKFDGGIAVQIPRAADSFSHSFLVTNIGIEDRDKTSIRYRISMVSVNWFDCIKTIDYTNYRKEPVQLFDILKACMQSAGLKIDGKSFDSVKSAVNLNYITNGNDNVFTISKYLLNKLCYYDDKDNSMKFIRFNDLTGKYGLFDINCPHGEKAKGNRILVSMDKSSFEQMTAQEQTQFASVVQFPKTSVFKSLFNRKIASYDFSTNEFATSSIATDTLANLYNAHGETESTNKKMHGIYSNNKMYEFRSALWHSTTDIYQEQLQNMFDNNALIVNTVGASTR